MAAGEPFSVVPCFVRVKQERTKRKMTPKPARGSEAASWSGQCHWPVFNDKGGAIAGESAALQVRSRRPYDLTFCVWKPPALDLREFWKFDAHLSKLLFRRLIAWVLF